MMKKPIIKSFMVSEADRYFKTDSSGEQTWSSDRE